MSREDRWAKVVDRYNWLASHEDAATALCEVQWTEPDVHAPVSVWVAWHEVQAECWSRLAARDSLFVWHDRFIGGYHRELARRLASAGWRSDVRYAIARRVPYGTVERAGHVGGRA